MRLIHTSDWHIGQTLNGWSRRNEHACYLEQLADLVEEHTVDCLLIVGDVFDSQNPSAEATRLLYEGLVAIRKRRPHLTTVLVAGNHDPAGRLEAPGVLLREFGVHAVGVMHRHGTGVDFDRHLIPVSTVDGVVRAHILAVPFLRSVDLPGLGLVSDQPGSPVVRATRRLYAELVAGARLRVGNTPLIATGHLHVAGSMESEGSERRILVGGAHAVPPDIFPADLAYVALGHLHKPQHVGRETVRYCGAPFPMSAAELRYDNGVTLIDVDNDRTEIRHISISRSVPFIRVPEHGACSLAGLDAALGALGLDQTCETDHQAFIYSVIASDGAAAGLPAEVERILALHPVRSAGVKVERPNASLPHEPQPLPMRLADCDPTELFQRAFEATHGSAPGAAHLDAFHQTLLEG